MCLLSRAGSQFAAIRDQCCGDMDFCRMLIPLLFPCVSKENGSGKRKQTQHCRYYKFRCLLSSFKTFVSAAGFYVGLVAGGGAVSHLTGGWCLTMARQIASVKGNFSSTRCLLLIQIQIRDGKLQSYLFPERKILCYWSKCFEVLFVTWCICMQLLYATDSVY